MTAIVESPLTAEQAESLEAAFLGGLEEAQFAYERIVEHEAWILLGFDRFADWWDERVTPTMRALSMRPTREIAAAVVERVREEEAELPPAQRRTQRELADMVGISTKTLQRQSQDRPQETLSSGADLEPGDSHAAAQYRCFGCTHIWPRSDKGNTCPKCGGWGVQHQERKPKDDTALPAHQEHADAALAAIDEWLQHQASAPPRIEPPDPEVRERLASLIVRLSRRRVRPVRPDQRTRRRKRPPLPAANPGERGQGGIRPLRPGQAEPPPVRTSQPTKETL